MSIAEKLTTVAENQQKVYEAGMNAMITRSLTKISSNTDTVGSHAFYNYTTLTDVVLPDVVTVGASSFYGCTGLAIINLPKASYIGGSALRMCTNLKTLILRREDVVCTLSNVNAFTGTPFASDGTGGTAYVPAALINSYQTATNWKTLYEAGTCIFVAIEGSEYE